MINHHRSALVICVIAIGVTLVVFLVHRHSRPQITIVTAAQLGDLDLLRHFESNGVNLNFQDRHMNNWTPLMAAIFQRQSNVVTYLLTQEQNVNLQDITGDTALTWAIILDDTDAVAGLLARGADPFLKNKDGVSAFGSAAGCSDTNLLYLLKIHSNSPRTILR